MDKDRIRFLGELVTGTIAGRVKCPSCGAISIEVVGRKHFLCELRRCPDCRLLYRTPTDKQSFNAEYYQEDYHEGTTTDVPDASSLERLKQNRFSEMEKNFDPIIDVLESAGLKPGAEALDFGCSWGYGAWQFVSRGYACRGYEISRPRASFARDQLGIELVADLGPLTERFDLFFSSHVLEHVPDTVGTLQTAVRIVRPGGLVLFITPNGSMRFKEKNPASWYSLWGRKHPTALDENFYQKQLSQQAYLLTSSFDAGIVSEYMRTGGQSVVSIDGPVLYCLVRK